MASMFGQYEILEKLGQGGMGAVYKARDTKLDRVVALKVMNPGTVTPQAYARFQREIKILAKLKHPNIVGLLAVGQVKNRAFFTMEYIEGKPLSARIKEASSYEERKKLIPALARVARAVHHAHEQGIIHRDLKPSNIIIDTHGEPHITDFGLARRLEDEHTVTVTGESIGTVSYMSPEQAEGDTKRIGPASDVWALGAILYEMLTDRPPFQAPSVAATLDAVLRRKPTRPVRLNSDISRPLDRLCRRTLSRNPLNRPRTALDFADGMEHALEVQHRGAGATKVRVKPILRFALIALMAVVVGLMLVFAIAVRRYGLDESLRRARNLAKRSEEPKTARTKPSMNDGGTTRRATKDDTALRAAAEAKRANPVTSLPLAQTRAEITSYLPKERPTCIAATENEVWWCVDGAAYNMDIATGQIARYPWDYSFTEVLRDQRGDWWFGLTPRLIRDEQGGWRQPLGETGLMRFSKGTAVWFKEAGSSVNGIAMDSEGVLWFAGRQLVSFDGRQWETHEDTARNSNDRRRHGEFKDIAIDHQGRKWMTASHAVVCYDGNRFTRHETVWQPEWGPSPVNAHYIAIGQDETFWLWSTNADLYTWQNGRMAIFFDMRKTVHNNACDVTITASGDVWIAPTGPLLVCYDGKARRSVRLPGLNGSQWAWTCTADPHGSIWAADYIGLFHIENGKVDRYPLPGESFAALSEADALHVDRLGRLWYGKGGDFFARIEPEGGQNASYGVNAAEPAGDSGNIYVTAMAVGSSGDLLIAGTSYHHGTETPFRETLRRFDGNDWENITEWPSIEPEKGLYDQIREWRTMHLIGRDVFKQPFPGQISAVASCADGAYWLGTVNEGIRHFDGTTSQVHGLREGVPKGMVAAMCLDARGQPWAAVGTDWASHAENTVVRFDGIRWLHVGAGQRDGMPVDLLVDDAGVVWLALNPGGLWRCDDGETWTRETRAGEVVRDIAFDLAGRRWFATDTGLHCFDGETWRTWTTDDFLPSERVLALAVDLDGSIWASTYRGGTHIVLQREE